MQRRLGCFQQTVSLAAGLGRYAGFPCSMAPAAIPSPAREQHSFLPTPFAEAQPRTLRLPSWAAPLSSRNGTLGSRYMCSGCRETQTRCLNINHTGSARLNVGMPFLVHMQHARGLHRWSSGSQHFAESKTHTHKCDRKPTKLSQFPVPALKNDSSPYSCKAQQACSGPDSADPCGTGRELTICTDAFFPSFYLQACVFTGGCGVHQGGQLCVEPGATASRG